MSSKNLQILLASRPTGEPTLENFDIREIEIPTSQSGRMLLRAIYLSLDPYLRGRMNAGKSYAKRGTWLRRMPRPSRAESGRATAGSLPQGN